MSSGSRTTTARTTALRISCMAVENSAANRRTRRFCANTSGSHVRVKSGTGFAQCQPKMFFFRQMTRTAARGVSFVLVVMIATGGIPPGMMACSASNALCQHQAATHDRCPKSATSLSCGCHGINLPANQAPTRATDLVAQAALDGPTAYTHQPPPDLAISRPDYPIARGRLLVPLPILHASLLI